MVAAAASNSSGFWINTVIIILIIAYLLYQLYMYWKRGKIATQLDNEPLSSNRVSPDTTGVLLSFPAVSDGNLLRCGFREGMLQYRQLLWTWLFRFVVS